MDRSSLLLAVLLPAVALAQSVPSLSGSSSLTLSLPYLEYAPAAGEKSGYAVSLSTANLSTFTLNASSLRAQTTFDNAANAPQVSLSNGTFRLVIPYLEYTGGGTTTAYSATLLSSDLASFSVDASSVREVTRLAAPTNVAVSNANASTVGTTTFSSSTRLNVSWTPPTGYTPDHYRIYASETIGNTNLNFTAAGSAASASLTGLKSGTAYGVTVKACQDSACSQAGTATAASGQTSDEVWQFQGSGASVSGLTKVVSDGNVRIAVMRYGSDAPDAVKNRLQLYYGPSSLGTASGLTTALTSAAADAAVSSTYLSFTSGAGTTGLQNPNTATMRIQDINAGQGLPMSTAAGGNVRLYFEARGSDGKTRIYYIGSQDGHLGKDFNTSSSSGVCKTTADYDTGGGCVPTVAIPVQGDTDGNPKISNARQFKIGYPMQTDWRWNEEAGTFMLFTVDSISGCTTYGHNQAYAVWNGSKWMVQYESGGCPKLFKAAQAATPVHLGGARYKVYFGDRSTSDEGKITSSPLPFLGPKKVLYGDGAVSSTATTLEFEDWETPTQARGLTFLWPSGQAMSASAEGYIDDFMAVAPTGSLDFQVLYVAITDGTVSPFSAAAVLLNP